MANPTPPTTIQAPKVHPMAVGAIFGLVAALINYGTIVLNKKVIANGNGLIGFAGTVLLPLVALYAAGHYAGRHQRLHFLQTTSATDGFRSVLSGTSTGAVTGIIYVILTALTPQLDKLVGIPTDTSAFGSVLGFLGIVGGLIVWIFLGLFGGTIGGVFGDSLAHRQLKAGAVVAK